MPFIDGESLRARMQRGPLSVRETVNLLRDVARALAFAHKFGVVHRDIKPDNVLLSAGAAVVTDFGVAKAIASARNSDAAPGRSTITAVGVSLGTPQYMAPEQAAADPTADHRVDLYALGVVGYEMLAGAPPFHGRSPHELLKAQLTELPPPITARRYDLSVALAGLIMQCLEKDPAKRPKSAADIARLLESSEAVSGEFAAPSAATNRTSRTQRQIVAAILLAAAAVVVWQFWPRSANQARPEPVSIVVSDIVMIGGVPDTLLTRAITSDLFSALTSAGLHVLSDSDIIDSRPGQRAPVRLSGTIQRVGQRIRVNLRVTSATGDSTVWAGRFDGTTGDLLTLEDSLASAATLALAKGAPIRR